MMKKAFLYHHLGLGDHLICNGLIRTIASDFDLVIVPVKNFNYLAIKRMFSDLINVSVLSLDSDNKEFEMLSHANSFEVQGYEIIRMGYYGKDFMSKMMRFDENFYSQLNLSFLKRWEKFFVPRVSDKEDEVYNLLVNDEAKKNGYIFLHEDRERSFVIDRKLLPQDVLIIEPKQNIKDINFFDYLKIIENADQIHCIESSFAALIESLGLNSKPKFAHRYARPEAFYDYKHEFTYRTEWTIYR